MRLPCANMQTSLQINKLSKKIVLPGYQLTDEDRKNGGVIVYYPGGKD